MVMIGGPDCDTAVPRETAYVLDQPSARTYRVAFGTKWLTEHRPDLDFVMYLDDDSYLHIPRLTELLLRLASPSLAMGFLMGTTPLDFSRVDVCDVCNPCERCRSNKHLMHFCKQFPEMGLGGCVVLTTLAKHHTAMSTTQACSLIGDDEDVSIACIRSRHREMVRMVEYFGSSSTPNWFLGMGWVFGRRIVDFIARNCVNLKMRGIVDIQMGFWLLPLEGIVFVDMKEHGHFHDYPEPGATFSAACTKNTVLVHRMNQVRWHDFDPVICELHCPQAAMAKSPTYRRSGDMLIWSQMDHTA